MLFEIGLGGLGLLVAIAALFGVAAQVVFWKGVRWMFLAAAIGWFIGGLVASEVIWGAMTVAEIQPIVDGLALDESLLGGLIGGLTMVAVVRLLTSERANQGRLTA